MLCGEYFFPPCQDLGESTFSFDKIPLVPEGEPEIALCYGNKRMILARCFSRNAIARRNNRSASDRSPLSRHDQAQGVQSVSFIKAVRES